MLNKLIDVYMAWYFSRPKWARVLLKAIGALLSFATCWIWLPALLVVLFIVMIVEAIIEFVEGV